MQNLLAKPHWSPRHFWVSLVGAWEKVSKAGSHWEVDQETLGELAFGAF